VFIELGLNIPQNGGIQEYLRYCYGDLLGCLFTWTWVFISKPSSMAIVSRVMAEHFCHAILPEEMISIGLIRFVAFLGFWGITIVNCTGARSGVQVAMGFLILKLAAVIAVSTIGLTVGLSGHGKGVKSGEKGRGWFDSVENHTLSGLSFWALTGHFVTALFGSLYCFSGWESVSKKSLVTWRKPDNEDWFCNRRHGESTARYIQGSQKRSSHSSFGSCLHKHGGLSRTSNERYSKCVHSGSRK
jgi:solute carrier family 7 (L-type amino acid transporter), member 6